MATGRPKRRVLRGAFWLVAILLVALPVSHSLALRKPEPSPDRSTPGWKVRDDALHRAQVFLTHPADIAALDLSRHPADPAPFAPDAELSCTYEPKESHQVSAKFDCRLPSGEIIKVKYGGNWEIPAEIAATRLLAALGFASDYVSLVKRIRCYGCPPHPFGLRRISEYFYAGALHDRLLLYGHATDFEWVSVERKLAARPFETGEAKGWSFSELAAVEPSQGGATRADLDALRLMAVFLSHFDNKPDNQRLVCLEEATTKDSDAPCQRPLIMLHDVGGTFGPRKAWFDSWRTTPMWSEQEGCWTSMESMPYGGVTFVPVHISEAGRKLLASRLEQLSEQQILTLFTAARFPDPRTGVQPSTDLMPWVRAFQDKVRQISSRSGCPE